MLGPTAENLTDKTATETTAEGIATLLDKGRSASCLICCDEEVTATYAGLRASTEHGDYQIYLHAATLSVPRRDTLNRAERVDGDCRVCRRAAGGRQG